MADSREILVSIMIENETLPVGKLWSYFRKGRTSAGFEYNKEWLANPKRFALDPALKLTEGQHYTDKALFGAIGDSAPDRWGRILMRRANSSNRSLSEIDYLLGVNDEIRQGALRFSDPAPNQEPKYLGAWLGAGSIPPLIKLPELLSAAEKFMENSESAKELKLLLAPGSSLGGARPKASVMDKDGSLAIAKFPRKDDDTDIIRWEAVALSLAKSAGINVPEWRLENILGKNVLIVKRFDREKALAAKSPAKQQSFQRLMQRSFPRLMQRSFPRIPFLSAMSMLGAADNDGLVHSYTEISTALVQHGSRPDKDMEELWRRMVFGIIISNTDDHLRNHGFLYDDTGWTLSPVYDINPNNEKADFATAIDESGARSTIELALKAAGEFRLSAPRVKEILEQVKDAVSTWRKTARSLGIAEQEIEKMKGAFVV